MRITKVYVVYLLILIFIFFFFSTSVYAQLLYDYRQYSLVDSQDFSIISDNEDEMQKQLDSLVREPSLFSSDNGTEQLTAGPVNVATGIKVYLQNLYDFVNNLSEDDFAHSVTVQDNYIWCFPVKKDSNGYQMTTATKTENGFVYQAIVSPRTDDEEYDYIFSPDCLTKLLEQYQLQDAEIIIPITVNELVSDFIYVKKSEKAYVIPFASRPEYLPVENKVVYDVDTFIDSISTIVSPSIDNSTNKKEVVNNHNLNWKLILPIVIGVMLVSGISAIFIMKLRKSKSR